jgi:NAD(P)-dependent dehydrogenase (short-subunit alcohol dehydrogenase family)
MSRFLLCGGDFCAFNLGFLADPCNASHEIACCNRGVGESGFGWHSTARKVCSSLGKRLDGKIVIVTGANGGVGQEAAKSFYEIGATVILACRSAQRAAAAKKLIESSAVLSGGPPGRLVFVGLDLGSLRSVESFAAHVNAMPEPLYALVCNGGIMATPFKLTEDGLEQQFQVNYLSHHQLTLLLLDKLKASAPSRIVNVSSISHAWVPFPGGCCGGGCALCFGGFDLGKRFPAKSGGCCAYEPFEDYSYSKAAQVIMTNELDRRLLRDTGVVAVALEPGLSAESGLVNGSGCLDCVVNRTCVGCIVGAIVGKSLPQMASTLVYAALADSVHGGDYLRNVNKAHPSGPAKDPAHGLPLWELSNAAVKNAMGKAQVEPPRAAAMS